MTTKRLLTVKQIEHLCSIGAIKLADAYLTESGWRVLFILGDKRSHSHVSIQAARGGERFYQSLDSLYQLLIKLNCGRLIIEIEKPATAQTKPKTYRLKNNQAYSSDPSLERFYYLQEKQRNTDDLTDDEVNEMQLLEQEYSVFK